MRPPCWSARKRCAASRPRRWRRSWRRVGMLAPTSNLLLARCGVVDPASIDDYEGHDGFKALRRAVEMGPEWVVEQLMLSGLVGRGGAAFPTGRKWAAVRAAVGAPKYVILNADESEP